MVPSDIKKRVRRAKPKNAVGIERAFLRDEIEKTTEFVGVALMNYRKELRIVRGKLSFFDDIRFCKLVNVTSSRLEDQTRRKKDRTLHWLLKTQIGLGPLNHDIITNLSSVELTDLQKDILCRGINFGIPRRVSAEEVKAEFEMCWQQLEERPVVSEDRREECRSTFAAMAYKYANAPLDKSGFPLDKEHMEVLRELRRNTDIVITKPDKGNGVVIMDRSDYNAKMLSILSQEDKFERIGEVEGNDNTLQRERALQAFLLRQRKAGHISEEDYRRIRPVGSSRPRMYGLPKTHKPGVPLRPILSMVNAPQHELAKWLASVLHPVLMKYNVHAVKDTFEFCSNLEACASDRNISGSFMCSFDVVSLYTNIPLQETLQICLDTLYRENDVAKPSMPEKLLKTLLLKATTQVEFSFGEVMYRQVDGVAMGSPLGPVLANIFMGYCESKVPEDSWPWFYNRFVDDTFSLFESESVSQTFFELLNGLHPALRFTVEVEQDHRLPFMDVAVERVGDRFVRSVYRKPTFTGLYTRWDSFTSTGQKINLIKSLASRAKKICSAEKIDAEIQTLKELFVNNGYPSQLVDRIVGQVLKQDGMKKGELELESDLHFALMRLPWIGPASNQFQRDIIQSVEKSFLNTSVRLSFSSTHAFSGKAKDVLSLNAKSNVVYEYRCCCGRTYVGKTTQCFAERIRQHVPDGLLKVPPITHRANSDSAVTKHLKESLGCIGQQPVMRERFRVLKQARGQVQLDVLEALFIRKLKPELCQQKDFVRSLKLF